MAVIAIERLSPRELKESAISYTAIPNALFRKSETGLEPRVAFFFAFLITLPTDKKWTLRHDWLAEQTGIGESTIGTYMTTLKKAGHLTYERTSKGFTNWSLNLSFLGKTATQKPELEKPHLEKPDVLQRNNLLQITKETTNEPVVVSLPDYVNNGAVKKELSTLEKTQQLLVLKILAVAMTAGKIETTPVSYALGLIKRAKNGLLSAPVEKTVVKAVDKNPLNRAGLREFMQKHRGKLREDFRTKPLVRSGTFGEITYDMFRNF